MFKTRRNESKTCETKRNGGVYVENIMERTKMKPNEDTKNDTANTMVAVPTQISSSCAADVATGAAQRARGFGDRESGRSLGVFGLRRPLSGPAGASKSCAGETPGGVWGPSSSGVRRF